MVGGKLNKGLTLCSLAGFAAAGTLGFAVPTAKADTFTVCPSGLTGVATADTSCQFADNVRISWYSQPGEIIMAFSPITGQAYTMQCTPAATTIWAEAKRCVGVNKYGAGLVVFIE